MERMDTSSFDDLLHQAEQLTTEIDVETDLPRVERNLRQLLEAGQQLWSRTALATAKDSSDVRASVLLGSKGYDLQKVSQQLSSFGQTKKVAPVEGVKSISDVQGFLKSERENAIMSVIDDVKKSTFENADKLFWASVEHEWDQEKLSILNALVGPNQEFDELNVIIDATPSASKTMVGGSSPVGSSSAAATPNKSRLYFERSFIDTKSVSAMDNIEIAYAKEVIKYVDHILHGRLRYNIAQQLLEKVAKDVVREQLITELWESVQWLTSDELPLPVGKDVVVHRATASFQAVLIKRARSFLEQKYCESIVGVVYGEPKSISQSHGVMFNLIKNYLNSKIPPWMNVNTDLQSGSGNINHEDGLVDGHPIWCFIWHCLRAGSVDAALEVAQRGPISSISNEFINILREYKESENRRLSPKSENQVRLQYKRAVRLSTDPYKRAVYCILGCCDVNEGHTDVIDKVDDFLWFRLCQIKLSESDGGLDVDSSPPGSSAVNPNVAPDRLVLAKLQQQLSEDFGEAHFNAQEQPFTYFKVLFLTGQFESAIEFLSRIDRYRCHAVHIAIALNELGLIALPLKHLNVSLLSKQQGDPPNVKRLNFARLITVYTRKFESNHPSEALYYYFLLRDLKSPVGDSLFVYYVSQLVRETKRFDTLLGYMNEDGCRIPGVIDKFNDHVQNIIDQVAVDCENNGAFEDAIHLYDLGSKHNNVLELLNRLLSSVVAERKAPDSKRNRLEALSLKLAKRYCDQGHNANREVAGTFFLLLDLMTFFDCYHNRQFSDALDTIGKLKLLPFRNADIDIKVNDFGQLAEEIRRNIPDVLLATMNILYSQYKDIKTSAPQTVNKFGIIGDSTNREQHCAEIRQKARSLITYAGMIPYRMPGDTNSRLVQLEVLMN